MRMKNLIAFLCFIIFLTLLFVILSQVGESNDSLKSIVSHTHKQFNKLQENLHVSNNKKLVIDDKYLTALGFPTEKHSSKKSDPLYKYQREEKAIFVQQTMLPETKYNFVNNLNSVDNFILQTKFKSINNLTHLISKWKIDFSIVTYVQKNQVPLAILLTQNIAHKFPKELLSIYNLGVPEEDLLLLNAYCNSTRCSIIPYDLSIFPSYITDERMHAYRSILIIDALLRFKSILFIENYIRVRESFGKNIFALQSKAAETGVLGWNTPTAVSTRTHPKMFEYFQTSAENFLFLRMIDLDSIFLVGSDFLTDKILLPWIKCVLTLDCIDPIGAQSNGCKYNKKPSYRYSGCHSYDASAFNIVLGLTWHLDDTKYSLPHGKYDLFYKQSLKEASKILQERRSNSTDASYAYAFD